VIHNAVGGAWGTFTEIGPAGLNRNFQVNTMGLLYFARRVAPSTVTAGKAAIIVTGNTSAQCDTRHHSLPRLSGAREARTCGAVGAKSEAHH
jgi:short-subunit dehydrogenase